MKYLEIVTPHGDKYLVNEQGMITQYHYDRPFGFSGQWRVTGVTSVRMYYWHTIFTFRDLWDMDLNSVQWRYKNGNPRFTLMDLDYGTHRVWGNTTHHGIKYITRIELDR